MRHPERPPRPENECYEHRERPPRPENECCEHPEKPPKPEDECCEHPHPHFRHPFPPQERMGHRHFPPMEHAPHEFDFFLILAGELSFSDEQVKKLQSIKNECEKSKIMIRARIKIGELELQELLNQSEIDLDKVDAKIKEIGGMKIESDINDVHSIINAKAVLTQEQKEKLKNLRPIPCNGHC
ncbi:MAG: hypothetical protein QG641_1015 [Candidatus Poribacteria bacterium]|nr:hypothetical protein [Candidatus Poribacteria bacterium]